MVGIATRPRLVSHRRLARPGRNCWRLARAGRVGVLVDAEAYFGALAEILPQARHSILILGWEFDSRCRLLRDEQPLADRPDRIGPLLDWTVRRRPDLRAHVLIWDSALIYAVNREFAGLVKMDWLTHPRLRFRLDDSHPLGASHHHKVVVIDDAIAFIGGLDVTSQRWDGRRHEARDPRRSDPGFPAYPPFHDVMAVVTGAAAAALGDLCRDRWRRASGETLAPPPVDGPAPWPSGLCPLFADIDVALSRTAAPWDGARGRREIERLYLDMIAGARRLIFIENQYFAARRVVDALAARLAEPDGPEIVIIGPGPPVNLMERSTMGVARARLAQRLVSADCAGNRFRYYRAASDGADIKIHSKLAVIDDRVLRIGSSNLNNRSMGLDSECDVTLEAGGDIGAEGAIRLLRHDLLGEHLGVAAAEFAKAEAEAGGVHAAIAKLAGGRRTLVPLDCSEPDEVVGIITDSRIPDLDRPMEFLVHFPSGPRWRALVAALAALSLAAALWRWAPPGVWAAARPWLDATAALRQQPMAALAVAALFTVGGLLRLPLAALVLAAAAASGPWLGTLEALAGALASASLHYLLGRALGPGRIRRLAGRKANRVRRALTRQGTAAIIMLRLMPVAAFAVVSLVAGSIRLRVRDFAIGTLVGMAPGIFAVGVVGDRMLAVLRDPSAGNIAVLALATGVVVAAITGLANRLGRISVPGA